MLFKYYETTKKLLESNNSKLKFKSLSLMKHFTNILSNLSEETSPNHLIYAKTMLTLLRNFSFLQKDSKIHYYSILNIGMIFGKILRVANATKSNINLDCKF